jgi:N-acyl-D-aspartate/D-glutamate deacylase
MAEYFAHIGRKGIAVNYAPLVGHGTVRYKVMERTTSATPPPMSWRR